jgi:hypothetical protein
MTNDPAQEGRTTPRPQADWVFGLDQGDIETDPEEIDASVTARDFAHTELVQYLFRRGWDSEDVDAVLHLLRERRATVLAAMGVYKRTTPGHGWFWVVPNE